MNFLRAAALVTIASIVSACGDAGDHFGEFRKTGARVVPVANVQLSLPPFNGPGVYPVKVTAFEARGNPVPLGNSYTHPILVTSNGPCTGMFGTDASSTSNFQATISITNTTTQAYVALTCIPVTIVASDVDMATPVSIVY